MEKVCAFAVLQTSELFKFKNLYAVETARKILEFDLEFVHKIVCPTDKKELIFTERNVLERFFTDNRKMLLQEVNHYEDSKYET